MMVQMKIKQKEFKWCKYILLSYNLPLDLFFHIKPFLFTPPMRIYYLSHIHVHRPYLQLSCILYNLECIPQQYMNRILFISEIYDRLGMSQKHTVSFFSRIEKYVIPTETAVNIANNWN